MTTHTRLVEQFVAAWHARDLDAIVGFLAPDIEYHNIPLEPVLGIERSRSLGGRDGTGQGRRALMLRR